MGTSNFGTPNTMASAGRVRLVADSEDIYATAKEIDYEKVQTVAHFMRRHLS